MSRTATPPGRSNSSLSPERGWFLVPRRRQPVVEPLRQDHLEAPRVLHSPAEGLEIVRCGGKAIRNAVPDIAPSVFVEVNGAFVVGRGHELRVPHRPRPRAGHALRRDVPLLQDAQRRNELAPPEAGPPLVPGSKRGERPDDIALALRRAVVRTRHPKSPAPRAGPRRKSARWRPKCRRAQPASAALQRPGRR